MKHPTHDGYKPDSILVSERALLSVWPYLADYHDDLVLVGGLVPRYICRPSPTVLPAVTMDVDLAIGVHASTGQYAPLSIRLAEIGFKPTKQTGRLEMVLSTGASVWLDFLTESPTARQTTAMVDDLVLCGFPGIDRALQVNRRRLVEGRDCLGADVKCTVRVAEVGPYLVLKLLAFGGRGTPKDAFDVFQIAMTYDGGAAAAIAGFAAEKKLNAGYDAACDVLRQYFATENSTGPHRCAEFCFGASVGQRADQAAVMRGELANFAQFLLEQ